MGQNGTSGGAGKISTILPPTSPATPTPAPSLTGDVYGNSIINIIDALIIAQYAVGLISRFC